MGVGMEVGAKSWWGLRCVGGGSCERSVRAVMWDSYNNRYGERERERERWGEGLACRHVGQTTHTHTHTHTHNVQTYFSSRWYVCVRKSLICAPPRLSEVSTMLPLKQFQFYLMLRWLSLSSFEGRSSCTFSSVCLSSRRSMVWCLWLCASQAPKYFGYSENQSTWEGCFARRCINLLGHFPSVRCVQGSTPKGVQYDTIQLYCVCVEKWMSLLARHLYKTFNTFYKTSTVERCSKVDVDDWHIPVWASFSMFHFL